MGRASLLAFLIGWSISCSVGTTAPAPDDGEQTFRDICSKCHGATGTGGLPMTPDGRRPRDFTDPAWQASVSDAQLEDTILHGKAPMPAFASVLTPAQVHGVIGKIRILRKDTER
jgi:mono/diheme cytochrome c family protein